MKTRHPLIVTASIAKVDLEPFDQLRRAHFPPERNFLSAHLTMFHRLPGEYPKRIIDELSRVASQFDPISAEVSGVRDLGAGVAFSISSPEMEAVRGELRRSFISWLGPQDMRKWQPHITVQNRVPRPVAIDLFRELSATFQPHQIRIVGLDLWEYLDGPWEHMAHVGLGVSPNAQIGVGVI